MEKVKVSVIIPVYNTAPYLKEALDSIRQQSLTELEIIAVNDGSTDDSLAILQSVQQAEPRLQVYSQVNQGQSVARNEALKHAKGEFIYFFDSDDYLCPEALEQCYRTATQNQSQVVFFDAVLLGKPQANLSHLPYQRKQLLQSTAAHSQPMLKSQQTYTGTHLLQILMPRKKFTASPCLNFISSRYLQEIHLRFYPGIIHEDQLFTFLLYVQATRICYQPGDFFHRRLREASTMTSPVSMRNIEGYLTVCSELKKFPREQLNEAQQELIQQQIGILVNTLSSTAISLPFCLRLKILKRLVLHFTWKLDLPSILLLLLPCLKLKKKKPL